MGRITAIKRFEIHDGEGVRTTLFLKGCPLRCLWCHNPEAISFAPEVSWLASRCIGCGRCAEICRAHSLKDGAHSFNDELCAGSGRCEEVCLGGAIKFYGREYAAGQMAEMLLEDIDFFEASGGGVTISGGEPLMQSDFCRDILTRVKARGVGTAIDTCGFAPRRELEKLIDCADVFLYDIKAIDPKLHERLTGKTNEIILDNLKYLNSLGKRVEVRVPYVPGLNDLETEAIARFLSPLKCVERVVLLGYHDLAGAKYASLGMTPLAGVTPPSAQTLDSVAKAMRALGVNAVNGMRL